jgi:hypothetical protein
MQPSPYTPGVVALLVPGRAHQIADFEERLSLLADLGRLVGRIRVEYAPRGLGKTSLLRAYQRRAEERGIFTIWVTAGESKGLISQIVDQISQASTTWASASRRAVSKHLEKLTVRLSVPGIASAEATLAPAANSTVDSRSFEALIKMVASLKDYQGVVILIDEIQVADPAGIQTLAYAWQHLQSEGDNVPAAVFTAGLPNSPDKVGEAVTFAERFNFRPLAPLEREAEEYALAFPAKELGVEWTPEALNKAVDIAHGYPYLVQLIGEASWVAAGRPGPGGSIRLQDVEVGEIAVAEDLKSLYRARWANSTAAERDLMKAMAILGDGPVLRAEIAKSLGVNSKAISVARAKLIDKGFIQPPSRGALEFTIAGFAEFIRRQDEE